MIHVPRSRVTIEAIQRYNIACHIDIANNRIQVIYCGNCRDKQHDKNGHEECSSGYAIRCAHHWYRARLN